MIPDREIRKFCILQACDDVSMAINTTDLRTNRRLSLRLSCQLVDGLVLLYQRQVAILMNDVLSVDAVVRNCLNAKHKSNKKKTNRKSEPSINLPRLDILPEETHTMIEVVPVQNENQNDFFGEVINPMTGLPIIDETALFEVVPEPMIIEEQIIPQQTLPQQNMPPEPEQMDTIAQQDVITLPANAYLFLGPPNEEEIDLPELQPLEDTTNLNRQIRRKRKRQPTVEEKKLSSAEMMKNMEVFAPLRCEKPEDDIAISIRKRKKVVGYLFSHPASNMGKRLLNLFQTNTSTKIVKQLAREKNASKAFEEARAEIEYSTRNTLLPPRDNSNLNVLPNVCPAATLQPIENIYNTETQISIGLLENLHLHDDIEPNISDSNVNKTLINTTDVCTPMSSERTPVSLGDTFDSSCQARTNYLSEEWECKPLMKKILKYEMEANNEPLTLKILIKKYHDPSSNISERMVASKVFFNLLKLKQNGSILTTKNDSNELLHIMLSQKFKDQIEAAK